MKHTPGPWIVNKTKKCLIDAPNENRIIAEARGGDLEERRANACLIAAAPDLLEACKEALSILPDLWGDRVRDGRITLSIDESVFYKLETAINKAQGV